MNEGGDAYEPIPARGIGAERFDEPALFYLTHQAVIDEWHSLRSTVNTALNDWLEATVREAIAAVAQQHGLRLARVLGPQKHVHLLAYPEAMPVVDSRPVVGVGLGWPRESVNPVSNAPFACVRRSARPAGKVGASALLDAGGREFRSRESCKGSDDAVWPLYTYIPAMSRWWTDLDAYLGAIIDHVDRYVGGLAGALEVAALAAQRSSVGPGDTTEEVDEEA